MAPEIRLFATDLDGTLLGVPRATQQFKVAWEQIPPAERPLLCYSSGRLLDDALQQVEKHPLPAPDYLICGVGTTVYNYRDACLMKEFGEILSENWDVEQVEKVVDQLALPIVKQPDHYQTSFKSSWYLDDASPDQIDELRNALSEAALDAHVVYSSMRHLDVLPRWANKGNALRWLLRHLDIPPSEALVAGDSGNDSAMFALDGIHGIVVGNAQPELLDQTRSLSIYQASPDEVCAYGLLAGLRHYDIIADVNYQEESPEQAVLYESLRTAGDDVLEHLSQKQLAFIRQGYHKAIDALQRNISPQGFTACSPEDNEVVGTDVNYRSVWGRDGALTILGSLPLLNQDDDIHACQRQTFITLLEHVSPNGQVPTNVRLADSSPDYSGVGGIASVDSGMWVLIAFYAYVAHTRDYDFLRDYFDPLKRAMDWLSAHDSNNDALLEIPEAGDWTDLFGRSYNVLYDEVLWYRSNICFGRLLQMKGDEEKAGDYLRWAQTIKREILANFWPSSQQNIYQAVSFADQQFSIGDARYLLAQLTPFDFSWRCDTFANILAFLYDVVDDKRASQAFRFMWGVGVNEPYPIANLYPAVSAGDKDWRPYYTVNLLNLPKHYHNGGIWPFVGGHWVRFIDKLGLRNVALLELYRLAELNKLGVLHEWEFNEWAHGETGRPMGKAYQAWSASEFIRACHALHVVASS